MVKAKNIWRGMTRVGMIAGFAMTAFLGQAAHAQTVLRISSAAADADWLAQSLRMFKDKVEKALPKQLAVQTHTASALFRQGTEVPALQRGNLEMSTMTTFEVEQQMPEYGVFSAGYMFHDYDHMVKVFRGPIGKAPDPAALALHPAGECGRS